ncbi:MAG: zinc dependent phospholipase C family protein [Herbinix sp.]|nr:zinc dependent phospholipase C family protein [Herbinix sp.]
MAGVITHMVIAREIGKRLPEKTITDMNLFYLGNLAPDSIHAREGYIRTYKKHTHFRDDILDKDFGREENLAIFHDRIAQFIIENRERNDGLLDLYRGYVSHILTDELFMLTIREEFCKVMKHQGIEQSDPLFFEYIVTDMNRNDMLLVENYEGSEEIRVGMEQVHIYPITGYLSEEEMCTSRNWLVRQHFYEKNKFLQPRFISYERTLEFVQMAADNIVERLSEGNSLPKMF